MWRSLRRLNVERYFLGKRLALGQPAPECLDKTFISLPSLGLRRGLRRVGQRRRCRQPEAYEQGQRFVGDRDVALKPLDLSGQPVETTASAASMPLGTIRRQE